MSTPLETRGEASTRHARQAKWRERNPLKRWAHLATASALKRGILVREPCEVCGEANVDAHHDDYDRPLRVRWLCRKHHKAEHRGEMTGRDA